MSEQLRATKFLLDRVKKLYPTFQYPDEIDVELWTEVLEGHSQTDILEALKAYRRETEYNKAPNPAEFKKFLAAKSENHGMRAKILKCADEVGDKYGTAARERYLKAARANWPNVDLSGHEWTEPEILECEKASAGDYAIRLMRRDIKLNRCRHLLPEYQVAVRYIAEDMLNKEIPVSEWRNMSFAERCAAAMKRGLFNRFDNVLVLVCRQRQGKECQFEPDKARKPFNPDRAVHYLGVHYRQQDSEDVFEIGA